MIQILEPKGVSFEKLKNCITVVGQTPRHSTSYVLANTIANVTSMLVDQVATFVYLIVAFP